MAAGSTPIFWTGSAQSLAPERHLWALILGAGALLAAIFSLWPGIDLAASRWFFAGDGFALRDNTAVETLRHVLRLMITLIFPLALLCWGWSVFRAPVLGAGSRFWAYVATLFLLGPGLIVNVGLKGYWGRPRPADSAEFGGALEFTPALVPGGGCLANCSFVSGEAAGATAAALSVAMLTRGWRHRRLILVLTWAAALFVIAQRVASGRHYLSDVLFAALIVWALALILARAFSLRGPGVAGAAS